MGRKRHECKDCIYARKAVRDDMIGCIRYEDAVESRGENGWFNFTLDEFIRHNMKNIDHNKLGIGKVYKNSKLWEDTNDGLEVNILLVASDNRCSEYKRVEEANIK